MDLVARRVTVNVIEYCTEEVERQGHDIYTIDGIERVGWMLNAWAYALGKDDERPFMGHAIQLGRLIEPDINLHGIRTVGVRVGGRGCPQPERILPQLTLLWEQRDILTPLEFYKAFEEVHPFVDGNGRTGKVLLNWLNGTLTQPIFPPGNLWGREIRNP